jgi:hypothetical protein
MPCKLTLIAWEAEEIVPQVNTLVNKICKFNLASLDKPFAGASGPRRELFQFHTLAFAHAGTWCTREDLNLRAPSRETGLQPVRFGLAHAPAE